jgi:hypothetical protein
MFLGHRWMKCYSSTSYCHYWMLRLADRCSMGMNEGGATPAHPMANTEYCDLVTDVPWAPMNEVPPMDQTYGHYWMLRLEDRCSMGIDEWSATQGPALWPLLNVVTWGKMFHGHRWMKYYPSTSLWPLLNVATWRQMFHGHRWMKCYPGTSPMAVTECCDMETYVPWASMNEVLPRDKPYGHYWMLWPGDRCCMGNDEWSATPACTLAITECCDLVTYVPCVSMNEVLPHH